MLSWNSFAFSRILMTIMQLSNSESALTCNWHLVLRPSFSLTGLPQWLWDPDKNHVPLRIICGSFIWLTMYCLWLSKPSILSWVWTPICSWLDPSCTLGSSQLLFCTLLGIHISPSPTLKCSFNHLFRESGLSALESYFFLL